MIGAGSTKIHFLTTQLFNWQRPKSIFSKTIMAVVIGLLSLNCSASFKSFEAPMDESKWSFKGNPIQCKLSHSIPSYGDAKFAKVAGKKQSLSFALDYKRHQLSPGTKAAIRAISPAWQPMQSSRDLGEVKLTEGSQVIYTENMASWRLLNELEVGRFPTFFYQDFEQDEDQVAVALSAVGFRSEYNKFLDCMASLVPYKLEELTQMTLHFDFDRDSIRPPYKPKLEALAAYVKHDPSVDIVFINGYTDSKGSRTYNRKLAQRRIDSVKNMLSADEVGENRFKTVAYGEKKPVASNRTKYGRAKNRRVYIKIAQK